MASIWRVYEYPVAMALLVLAVVTAAWMLRKNAQIQAMQDEALEKRD